MADQTNAPGRISRARRPRGCSSSAGANCVSVSAADTGLSVSAGLRARRDAAAPPALLLVLVGEHLADEPERDQLDADDHQQDPEHEQRPAADPRAAELEDGEVGQDQEAAPAEQQADPAEEVQRPIAVAAHECDGEQVEEAAHVPLRPVARAAVSPRPVAHRDLGGAVAEMVGEDGDETMELAVELDVLQHLGAVRLQAAVHVVQTDAGDERRRSVVDPGDDAAAERIAPV